MSAHFCGRCGHRSAIEHLRGECFECNEAGGLCAYSDPECPTCNGSGEVPVNPDAAWSGHVQALTFTTCPECAS